MYNAYVNFVIVYYIIVVYYFPLILQLTIIIYRQLHYCNPFIPSILKFYNY